MAFPIGRASSTCTVSHRRSSPGTARNVCRPSLVPVCAALVLALAVWAGAPSPASAQQYAFRNPGRVVGMGLWYGWSWINIEAPPETADPATKGFLEILPSTIEGQGGSFGLSYGTWGINVGYTFFDAHIDKKADIQQDGDPANDVTVLAMQGRNLAVNLLFQPVYPLMLGYGQDRGTLAFQIVDPTGVGSTKKLRYENDFYVVGAAWGFRPDRPGTQFMFILYAKLPANMGDEVGSSAYGFGLGVYL